MDLDSPNIDSLFDFLYVDRSRLAAFAAQLENRGVLQSTKTIDSNVGKSGGRLGLGHSKVLGLHVSGESESSSSIEQQFDASWSLPLNVLDQMDEAGFIRPSIEAASLGDVFVTDGAIRLLDYRSLKECWELITPFVTPQGSGSGKVLKQAEKDNVKNTMKLLQKLPHSIELIFHDQAGRMIWTCPTPDNLTVSSETLTFSHGSSIPGKWFMVASLDAIPAKDHDALESEMAADFLAKPMVKDLQIAMSQMLDGLRGLLGRPYAAFGATPLVIFRKTRPVDQTRSAK